jgi:hypothetical protein
MCTVELLPGREWARPCSGRAVPGLVRAQYSPSAGVSVGRPLCFWLVLVCAVHGLRWAWAGLLVVGNVLG